MKYNIGLVLSGGGIRAVAHIGLLKALVEQGIRPNIISGSSGGALIAALYANGYTVEEMLSFFYQAPKMKFSLRVLRKPGFINSEKYIPLFKKFFPSSFDQLNIPIIVTATNLLSGELVYFTKGKLIRPLMASSAIPPIFSPIPLLNSQFADGGILNNFPAEPLFKKCNYIIGSYVNPIETVQIEELNSTLKLIERTFHLGLDKSHFHKFKDCTYVFTPAALSKIGILQDENINKAFEIGYLNARDKIDSLLKSLN